MIGRVDTRLPKRITEPTTGTALARALWARPPRSTRRRRQYAERLEKVVDPRSGSRPALTAVVPVSPEASGAARGVLLDLAERLRQPRPVQSEGIALVRSLLCDGAGPLYCGEPGELSRAALIALQALESDVPAT
jgi:hypothetical protein